MKAAQQLRAKEISKQVSGFGNPRADRTIHVLVHKDHGVFIGTATKFKDKFNLHGTKHNAVIKGKSKSYRGWSLNNFKGRYHKASDYDYTGDFSFDCNFDYSMSRIWLNVINSTNR